MPHELCRSRLTIAGASASVAVVGRALFARLHPALAHLQIKDDGDAAADLAIRIWDGVASGSALPDDASAGDPGMNGTVDVSANGRLVTHRRRTSISWLDREAGELLAYFPDADRLALYDRSKPIQLPLAVWHLDRGVPLVHAGVVGRADRGVLFPGKGGSGKSTAALSCALAGFDYLGDDCVGLERRDDGAIRAYGVYGSTNLEPHHLERFPVLRPHAIAGTTPDEDKDLVLLDGLLPRPLARSCTLAAVAIPRVVPGATTRLVPATRAEALRALAPSTVLFFPGFGAKHLAHLAGVLAAVPCYRFEMGPDLAAIAPCLDELLSR